MQNCAKVHVSVQFSGTELGKLSGPVMSSGDQHPGPRRELLDTHTHTHDMDDIEDMSNISCVTLRTF